MDCQKLKPVTLRLMVWWEYTMKEVVWLYCWSFIRNVIGDAGAQILAKALHQHQKPTLRQSVTEKNNTTLMKDLSLRTFFQDSRRNLWCCHCCASYQSSVTSLIENGQYDFSHQPAATEIVGHNSLTQWSTPQRRSKLNRKLMKSKTGLLYK